MNEISEPRRRFDPFAEPLRWGIAGYGDIVERRIAPALSSAATKGRLVAVWGRDAGRARMLAERYDAPIGTDDFACFCDTVDAAYIATPVASHIPLALAALERNLAVLIEKPLSGGLGDLSVFLQRLQKHPKPVGVAYYRRLLPAVRWLSNEIASGACGQFEHAFIDFACPFDPAPDDPKAWRLDREIAAGGVLADAGVHRIDLLCALFGKPRTVSASFRDFRTGGCEREASLLLTWRDGSEAVIQCRWAPDHADRLDLSFSNGRVTLDPLDSRVVLARQGQKRLTHDFDRPDNPHLALIQDFESACAAGHPPVCSAIDGLTVDSVFLAAREASVRQCPIDVKTRPESIVSFAERSADATLVAGERQ